MYPASQANSANPHSVANSINRGRNVRPADITTKMVALDLIAEHPVLADLYNLFGLATKELGTTFRLPWVNDGNQTSYSISVCFVPGEAHPVWKLKQGFGAQAADVFVHKSGDAELIHNLLCNNFY